MTPNTIHLMKEFIADFHIHSHYSIATSKELDPEHLDMWAKIKGIRVVGTGDFTHPGWVKELEEKLEPAESGLFRLKPHYRLKDARVPAAAMEEPVRFVLTAEISNIYKSGDRVRKVHNVIFAPDFGAVRHIQERLSRIGNITSDGRPILGMDSRDLLELCLDASPGIFFVPAHIWTPWFSVLGAKSGFDTVKACYRDLAQHIHAVETGLSSDAPMNWICRFLDGYTLISNSDAHSPEKLGRNANIFLTELSYPDIVDAMRSGDPERFRGTIDLFPQEGKYHYDGHRKCGVCWNPVETVEHGGLCPVCGKKITVGVMHRVLQLSDRDRYEERPGRLPFFSLIPLKEILSGIRGVGAGSKAVAVEYHNLIHKAGPELHLLRTMPCETVERVGGERLAEAIRRMRNREVIIEEGFDGQYGRIRVFRDEERKFGVSQPGLFGGTSLPQEGLVKARPLIDFDLEAYRKYAGKGEKTSAAPSQKVLDVRPGDAFLDPLDSDQREAVTHGTGPALILAGPGTGKTRVLTTRIAFLIREQGVDPENLLAVTFTNKAAEEMRERLVVLLSGEAAVKPVQVSTFHAFGLLLLRQYADLAGRGQDFRLAGEEDQRELLVRGLRVPADRTPGLLGAIRRNKQDLKNPDSVEDPELAALWRDYENLLEKHNLFDLDDLVTRWHWMFRTSPDTLQAVRNRFQWVLVDEYQDVNRAQYRLIRTLMPDPGGNICVIGDPQQAIYGFRGADAAYIERFQEDYPDARIYRLGKSYRCSNRILQASDHVIRYGEDSGASAGNGIQGLEKGVKISISQHPSDRSEAEFVARTIERLMGGLRFFSLDSDITEGYEESEIAGMSEIAVLCRIHRQMRVLEKAFQDHSIPYQRIGERPFFQRDPARSVLEIFRLAWAPDTPFLKERILERKKVTERELRDLAGWREETPAVREMLSRIISRYFPDIEEEEALKRLLENADGFGRDYAGFFTRIALGSGADDFQNNVERVSLMTLHAAKGLEFTCVFIPGCEDGLLPYTLLRDRSADPLEERRLFYVGMTRAKRFLYLSHAGKRRLMGRTLQLSPTSFLNPIREELVQRTRSGYAESRPRRDEQMGLFS